MEQERHSAHTRQAGMLAACLMLTVGAAWAASWTHDGIDGAVTVLALPGGQATLARDGADRQTRTITYVSTAGTTTTITRDYGPSGHKAVEVENGTLHQHVYGTGLAPLLRVEGDGSLSYQVGMDTISVDAAGSATVAHRIADIKRSTVAVLDAGALPQQRVSYRTLGQSRREQESDNAYTDTAQRNGYEGLRVWWLDSANQLLDNRARVYFPLAGRFLALDAAGEALGYEARGNNWIVCADYDGNVGRLINVLRKDPSIVLGLGDDHNAKDTIYLAEVLSMLLDYYNIPYLFFSERNVLFRQDGTPNPRVSGRFAGRLMELGNAGLLYSMEVGDAPEVSADEERFIRAQLLQQGMERNKPLWSEIANSNDYTCIYGACSTWNLENIMRIAARKKAIAILFMGAGHLANQKRFEGNEAFYKHPVNGRMYRFMLHQKEKVISLHPLEANSLVNRHKLLAIAPYLGFDGRLIFNGFREPYHSAILILEQRNHIQQISREVRYQIFTPPAALDVHPSLKKIFFPIDQQEEEKKQDSEDSPTALNPLPVMQANAQPIANPREQNQDIPNRGALEVMDAAVEEAERGKESCCNCCLVQ